MDGSKIKNVIIAVLLAVNLFFLVIIISDAAASDRSGRKAREDIAALLADGGIQLDTAVIPDSAELTAYALSRSVDFESGVAAAVIGEAEAQDQGGNIYYYGNENGWARFRGSGEFEIYLQNALEGEPEKLAQSLLSAMGLETGELMAAEDGGLSCACRFGRTLIYNCRVSFAFEDGRLLSVTGRLSPAPGEAQPGHMIAPATALMRFLAAMRDGGYICNRIEAMEAGYASHLTVSGEGTLSPVWRIETDAGEYYLDGETGSLLQDIE